MQGAEVCGLEEASRRNPIRRPGRLTNVSPFFLFVFAYRAVAQSCGQFLVGS